MDIHRRRFLQLASSAALALARPSSARAQSYPSRVVRIVVGFPAGGPLDIAARTVAPFLSSHFGQAFVIENRPGASGNTAASEVVRAAPDGHTLLLCGPVYAINASLFENLDFDFARDITPVASIARVPLVIKVNPSVPARSVPEFLAFARDNPGRLRVAYAGVGTPQHIAIELFQFMTGVRVTLVPYPGSAPALADLLRGEVDAMFDSAPSSMPHIRAGRLIALATTGPTRSEVLSHVPAMSEFVPGYEAGSWFGLGAPRDTPGEIVHLLNAAVNNGLADQTVRARFRELDATVMPASPTEFGRFIDTETDRYRRVIRSAGIKPAPTGQPSRLP
ncbi:MAG TPA: tripartite tricarboxylate transporter substrate binding protein [Microvirga sp.]|nr:tripartite tricarboxylate transporter substrate binding protein [Microvirga sp.]